MSAAPEVGFFAHGSETYRYRLSHEGNGVRQWTVTRTEAAIVETPARADQEQVESIILADFGPETPGQMVVDMLEAIDVGPPAEVCGACGSYVSGGSDPAVMSDHDCESEEQ